MIAEEMRKKVMDKLHEIEEREKVKVLYAEETASRAWGFPS
ncbi:MAG: nucleotidyltransferase domain-containing protein [Bacteroidaceae bacterium]|nr:nucleotidyltransferase domain-containing protein [Bacteroidaceae bacterium]